MPTFDFMTLLWWGLPFAAAPVIIHLINLLRHRVIRWPAMEFLLASQRKYRTRILLKQLLLLLLRILAIVGLALLFAQPRWDRNLGGVLGATEQDTSSSSTTATPWVKYSALVNHLTYLRRPR